MLQKHFKNLFYFFRQTTSVWAISQSSFAINNCCINVWFLTINQKWAVFLFFFFQCNDWVVVHSFIFLLTLNLTHFHTKKKWKKRRKMRLALTNDIRVFRNNFYDFYLIINNSVKNVTSSMMNIISSSQKKSLKTFDFSSP